MGMLQLFAMRLSNSNLLPKVVLAIAALASTVDTAFATSVSHTKRNLSIDRVSLRSATAGLIGTVSAGMAGQDRQPTIGTPLQGAGVYAYRITDLALHKARTNSDGGFSFSALPVGIYKVIAHKAGFLPAVAMVTRTTASALQTLQLELFPANTQNFLGAADTSSDFWEIRKRIPADVLRDIQVTALQSANDNQRTFASSLNSDFSARMHALTGSGRFANGSDATLVGGNFDIAGHLGDLNLGIVANYRTLQTPQAASLGTAQSIALRLDHNNNGTFAVSSRLDSIATGNDPVDLERYRLRWNGDLGPGHSAVSANYTNETNYYRDVNIDHFDVAAASRTLDLTGSYAQRFGPRGGVKTGIKYRRRMPLDTISAGEESKRIEWYSLGDVNLRSSATVQYGIFTTFHNGGMALSPQAGIVFELPNNWTAETSMRRRLHESSDPRGSDFQPAHYGQKFQCTSAESSCYRLTFTRSHDGNTTFEIGTMYRQFADTLRLYFTDNLFDDLDSLFFVDGDQLPELRVGFSRRISPNVLTGFSSNLARGGGGTLAGGLENRIRYLVTSFNAQFERSETGVVLSLHSLNQRLLDSSGENAHDLLEKDRLQLLLTQGLSRFIGFTPDLDLILDLQITRSQQQIASLSTEFSRRILGGVALRF